MHSDEEVKRLLSIDPRRIDNMKEGDLILSRRCVCESGAGFYVGRWCIEKMGDMVVPQPYDREGGYWPTYEQALAELNYGDE